MFLFVCLIPAVTDYQYSYIHHFVLLVIVCILEEKLREV